MLCRRCRHLRSSSDPLAVRDPLAGGTAYLSLESQEEPYLGGVKYTAMPPTKRFRDMEQLSGAWRAAACAA